MVQYEFTPGYRIIEKELLELNSKLPSGSEIGFNEGPTIELNKSRPERLVFSAKYYHTDREYRDRITTHGIIVTPSLVNELKIIVTGENYENIKDYIEAVFWDALMQEIE
jgi:hypothetical protein